ncbi:MAG: hypothetical protein ACI97X_000416 [Oceanospirillaceae bacterium]|jgi:hypothetical protein
MYFYRDNFVGQGGILTFKLENKKGYKNLVPTAIYAHGSTRDLSKIKRPLDRIFKDNELKNKRLT